jgi:hypothetical protein
MEYDLDIKDERMYDFLAEKDEQESTEEEYGEFYDEDWQMEDLERWRD